MIDYRLIGQRIKAKRAEKGLTQEKVAEVLDISVSYISRIERAAVKISLETLVKMALCLGVTPAFLISGAITETKNYLQSELADVVSDFSAGKMKLTLEIAQSIKNWDNNTT